MMFRITIAGVCIEINSLYTNVRDFCTGFIDDCHTPDLLLRTELCDLQKEAYLNGEEWPAEENRCAYLQILAIYRKIAEAMLERETILLHGVVLSSGVMITAPSGTGKTTHARLWLNHVPGSHVINGDKPLIHVGEQITAYGTPWRGKENMGGNESVPLKAICLLERGQHNAITRVQPSEILTALIHQIYLPKDYAKLQKTLMLFNAMCDRVAFYRICCDMEPDAALTVHDRLQADGLIS